MDYFEEPPVVDTSPPSDTSVELVMLLTKNMTRVMDLFRKVRCASACLVICSTPIESVLLSAVGYQ